MNDPRQTARGLLETKATTLTNLWIKYWGEGGNVTEFELDAYIHEALRPHPFDLKLIDWATEDLDADSHR